MVSFSVRSCGAAALTDAGGVVVRYSLNGGATWTAAAEQTYGFALSNTKMKRVNVALRERESVRLAAALLGG